MKTKISHFGDDRGIRRIAVSSSVSTQYRPSARAFRQTGANLRAQAKKIAEIVSKLLKGEPVRAQSNANTRISTLSFMPTSLL